MEGFNCGGTVYFNVGGRRFMVFISTLVREPDCLLTHMATGAMRTMADADGSICIDRDPTVFEHILNYFRYGAESFCHQQVESGILKMLLADADFYRLPALKNCLSNWMHQQQEEISHADEETGLLLSLPCTESSAQDEPQPPTGDSIVELNVGGVPYSVALNTLRLHPNSMLGAMFGETWTGGSRCDAAGRFFIDRDGQLFRHVLNFLRNGSELKLPQTFVEFDQLLAEADFFQIPGFVAAIEALQVNQPTQKELGGIYLEVKDTMVWFRGFHINTSLVGPLRFLRRFSPFREEFDRCANENPTRVNMEPFYTSWSKGVVEEVYLNFQRSKSRLEWAMLLKASGWHLKGTSCCCSSSNNHDQTFIAVDKWFLVTDNLPPEIFEEPPQELLRERRRVEQQHDVAPGVIVLDDQEQPAGRDVPIEAMPDRVA